MGHHLATFPGQPPELWGQWDELLPSPCPAPLPGPCLTPAPIRLVCSLSWGGAGEGVHLSPKAPSGPRGEPSRNTGFCWSSLCPQCRSHWPWAGLQAEGLLPEPAGPLTWVYLAPEGKPTDNSWNLTSQGGGGPPGVWGPHVAWKGSQGCSPTIRQVFHVAYVLIKFANSPRPDLWVLERSTDFGHTYQPWQYFACESPGMRGWQGGIPWVGGLPVLCSQGLWIPGLPSCPASRWARLWGAYS